MGPVLSTSIVLFRTDGSALNATTGDVQNWKTSQQTANGQEKLAVLLQRPLNKNEVMTHLKRLINSNISS